MTNQTMSRICACSIAIISLGVLAPLAGSVSGTPSESIVLAATKAKKETPVTGKQKCPPGQTAMPNRGRSKSVTCM